MRHIRVAYQLSENRACGLALITRWSNRYQSCRDPQNALRLRLKELAGARTRYGYRRLTVLLRREGWQVNAKRIYRLYRKEQLQLRTSGYCTCACYCPRRRVATNAGAWIS